MSEMVRQELHEAWETILLLKSENEKLRERLDEIRQIVGRGDSGKHHS